MATVVAFLSTETTDAKDLLDNMSNQCYHRADNSTLANDKNDLLNYSIDRPLDQDVDGNDVGTSKAWTGECCGDQCSRTGCIVWKTEKFKITGTAGNGVKRASLTCNSWTTQSGKGTAAQSSKTDFKWLQRYDDDCDSEYPLLCVTVYNVSILSYYFTSTQFIILNFFFFCVCLFVFSQQPTPGNEKKTTIFFLAIFQKKFQTTLFFFLFLTISFSNHLNPLLHLKFSFYNY